MVIVLVMRMMMMKKEMVIVKVLVQCYKCDDVLVGLEMMIVLNLAAFVMIAAAAWMMTRHVGYHYYCLLFQWIDDHVEN